jgi:O-antigen/teichoic acid export membrane protein
MKSLKSKFQSIERSRLRRLSGEGIWILIGQIATVAASFVLVRVLTENLDPEQYGQLALGLTIASLMNQVVIGGIVAGIGRFYSIAAEKQDLDGYLHATRSLLRYAATLISGLGLILMAILYWFGYLQWMWLTAAALVFSILSGFNSALSGIQNAARQRAVVAWNNGLDGWLKILLALGVIFWLGHSSTAVVIGYALSTLLVTGSQFIFLRRLIKNPSKIVDADNQWLQQIWIYSWPMAAGGLFNWGYYASQRWALELFTTTGDVGHFYALTQIAYTPITVAAGMLMSFLTPILYTRAGAATDNDRLRTTHRVVIRVALFGFGFTLLLVSLSFFMHETIFRWLVTSDYRQISLYMPYVILAAGILSVSQALSVILTIENDTIRILPLAIIGNGSTAALNFYLTYQWGMKGLIAAMVIGALIHLTWMLKLVLKNIDRIKI